MTFREFMQENGYDLITTFWEDFSIADKYGVAGVKDTYKRAFSEWEDDYKFFTELTLVLNHKTIGMWMWGDVKGYVLEKKVKFVKKYKDKSREDEEGEEWEEVDSCWGYYMETDELIEEIMKEHNLKE